MECRQKEITNNRGFSLIEAMVFIGIMSIAALSFSQMFVNMQGSIDSVEERLSILTVTNEVQNLTLRSEICTGAMGDGETFNKKLAKSKGKGLPIRFSLNANNILQDGQELPDYGLIVNRVYLHEAMPAGQNSAGDDLYLVKMKASFSSDKNDNLYYKDRILSSFYVAVNPDDEISNCFQASQQTSSIADLCSAFGGEYDEDTGKCDGGMGGGDTTTVSTIEAICKILGTSYDPKTKKCKPTTVAKNGGGGGKPKCVTKKIAGSCYEVCNGKVKSWIPFCN